jgi:hypothetical protein
MTQSATGLWNLAHEPWYVIVGVIVVAAAAMWGESLLKKRGWWPYKGENMFVDQFIWILGMLVIVFPILLVARMVS